MMLFHTFSDVLGAMQDPDAGVLMTKCTIDDTEYENAFSGKMILLCPFEVHL